MGRRVRHGSGEAAATRTCARAARARRPPEVGCGGHPPCAHRLTAARGATRATELAAVSAKRMMTRYPPAGAAGAVTESAA